MLLVALVGSMAYAYQAEVKKADVSLVINDQNRSYKAGERFSLNAGDIVCFESGDGRVVIKGETYKKQLSKRSTGCKILPGASGEKESYAKAIEGKVVSVFEKTKEKSVNGVSRKSADVYTMKAPIAINPESRYLVIENNRWILPVTLRIRNEKGEVLHTMTNEEDLTTSFVLPRTLLKDGYSIVITNGLDDVVVESKIVINEVK
jgi:hypothetical protein